MKMLFQMFLLLAMTSNVLGQEGDTDFINGLRDTSLSNPAVFRRLIEIPEVRADLELTKEQMDLFEKQSLLMRQRLREYSEESRKLQDDPRKIVELGIRKKFADDLSLMVKQLDDQLLPHQQVRLRQVAFQYSIRENNVSSMFLTSRLSNELGLSDEQIEKIRKIVTEHEGELKKQAERLLKQIDQISLDSRGKIDKILTPEQRVKSEKLVGKKVEFHPGTELYKLVQAAREALMSKYREQSDQEQLSPRTGN